MKSFAISRFQAGLIQSAFYMGYFVLAIPAGLLMRRLGYKAGFITGLLLFGSGAFLFWPAALAGRYSFFLAALFVIASGLSFLETASNPFIAQCGDPETSERRLNFSQAFNPLGSITGGTGGDHLHFFRHRTFAPADRAYANRRYLRRVLAAGNFESRTSLHGAGPDRICLGRVDRAHQISPNARRRREP